VDANLAGETTDPEGERVVLFDAVWREKIVRDHPEIGPYMSAALQAVTTPDHVAPDPIFAERTRCYARGAGPSQWSFALSPEVLPRGSFYKPIRRAALRASQFPSQVPDAKGTVHKPPSWS
jgi:hypothetical protein